MTPRYVVRGLLGVLLGAGSVVLASLEIYHLVRTGSCASGGPYVSARPCPSGTGLRILALIGSIFVLAPVAVVVFASRAKGIGSTTANASGISALLWTFGWIGMGSAAWVAGHGPAAPSDGGEGSTAVAITFWGIGGFSLLGGLLLARGARATQARVPGRSGPAHPPKPAQAPKPRPAPAPKDDGDDLAARLRRLDGLKAQGLVTQEEYDAKRRAILGEI